MFVLAGAQLIRVTGNVILQGVSVTASYMGFQWSVAHKHYKKRTGEHLSGYFLALLIWYRRMLISNCFDIKIYTLLAMPFFIVLWKKKQQPPSEKVV